MPPSFTLKTDIFEGPLDLLLSLIEKRKLHISDIALAQVTDDYIAYLERHPDQSIADTSHFILIASTLLLIKSKSLLPTLDLTPEEEASVEDLQHRLKLYEKVQAIAKVLGAQFGSTVLFEQQYRPNTTRVFAPHSSLTAPALAHAIRNMLSSLPKAEVLPEVVVRKVINLEDVIDDLSKRVSSNIRMSFKEFTGMGKAMPREQKVNVIVGFLAMLELVKNGVVKVTQDDRFSDIHMESESIGVPRY